MPQSFIYLSQKSSHVNIPQCYVKYNSVKHKFWPYVIVLENLHFLVLTLNQILLIFQLLQVSRYNSYLFHRFSCMTSFSLKLECLYIFIKYAFIAGDLLHNRLNILHSGFVSLLDFLFLLSFLIFVNVIQLLILKFI